MKKGSCKFHPDCPPCFGLCGTSDAPYDMGDNKPCDGCESCRSAKERKSSDRTKIDTVISQLYSIGAIRKEALSILYVEDVISKDAFYKMKEE